MSKYFQFLCSREERKWMEKQNKTVRQKRKKEDMARIRTLVGTPLDQLYPSYRTTELLASPFSCFGACRQCVQL